MDEDLYANVDVSDRSMESLLKEFDVVSDGATFLFEHLTEIQSQFLGNNITYPISARAIDYMLIGHVIHHTNVIKERYVKNIWRKTTASISFQTADDFVKLRIQ